MSDEDKEQKVEVTGEGGLAEFASRFSASKRAPADMGGEKDNVTNREDLEQRALDAARHAKENEARKAESTKIASETQDQRKKPFIKQQIEQKRTAEAERDELKGKYTELEAKLQSIENEKASLQAKIDSGDFSTKKEAEFQQRITELESKWKEEKDSLVNENQKIKSRLSFHDLAEDETFQREYLQPVVHAHREAVQIIGEDKGMREAFNQALITNAASLRATGPEERAQLERQRDDILTGMVEKMNGFSANRFTKAVTDYIDKSKAHADALNKHEETRSKLTERVKEVRNREYSERLQTWDRTYKTTKENYAEDAALSDEEMKIAKELGIPVEEELKQSEHLAAQTIVGATDMVQAIDLVHKGRVYPALKARNQILQKQLKDRDAIIAKLRGGGTGGGESDSSTTTKQKESREEWQNRKFGASRVSV